MAATELERQIATIASLDDPVRRGLYLYVSGRGREVGRDEAARAVRISRALAAFHLDKLVRHGLLVTTYRRLTKRRGPGAGRPVRRAAFSVVANIAEGAAKRGRREFRRYLDIALGSVTELQVALRLARDRGYLTAEAWAELEQLRNQTGKVTWGLYRAMARPGAYGQ